MEEILLIILSAFAVFGAWCLARYLAKEPARPAFWPPLMVLVSRPLTASQVLQIAERLEESYPRWQLFCSLQPGQALPADLWGERIICLPKEQLARLVCIRLDLQEQEKQV